MAPPLEAPPGNFSLQDCDITCSTVEGEDLLHPFSKSQKFLFLDIFSGASAPLSEALRKLQADCFQPIDLIFGPQFDLLDDDVFHDLVQLASSGLVGAPTAAPYCSKHSMATLRCGGPKPVRTPMYLDGLLTNTLQQDMAAQESAAIHDRARYLLTRVAARGGFIVLENPISSMTWLDEAMSSWVHSVAPFLAHVAACEFGTDWNKAWLFVCNRSTIHHIARACSHDPKSHQQVAGVRLADGSFFSRLTACYPSLLAEALAELISPWVSHNNELVALKAWRSLLPARLEWPFPIHRIEDGGGVVSSAIWSRPLGQDHFASLRKAWLSRILDSKAYISIARHLHEGSLGPPLDDDALQPYLQDLLTAFNVEEQHRATTLAIVPGQPFRLWVWKLLLTALQDSDVGMLDELSTGVRLGVYTELHPCPLYPPNPPLPTDSPPLLHCTSSWKSALDHPDIVSSILEEEMQAGFIEPVVGGMEELQSRFQHTAVGKLGLVLAESRQPRLVVDSSVSNDTCIPSRTPLPRISDVMEVGPPRVAVQSMQGLTLDVSKAHRRIKIAEQDGGLLCFWFQGTLYRCITLNFGARASGYYWGRCSGLMIRSAHHMLFLKHAVWQYVDDLLAALDASSAPVWASLLAVLFMVLNIPMSWHKAALGPRVVWIGWEIHFDVFFIRITEEKKAKLLSQVKAVLDANCLDVHELESIIGRLLWVTSLWHSLRPLLGPLYQSLAVIPATLTSVSQTQLAQVGAALDDELTLTHSLTHPSLLKGVKILKVGNTSLESLAHFRTLRLRSRRIWLAVAVQFCGLASLSRCVCHGDLCRFWWCCVFGQWHIRLFPICLDIGRGVIHV